MTYQEKLKDARWLTKRTEIMIRDNFKCQHPGCAQIGEGIEVHHLDYLPRVEPWDYPNDMLLSLCRNHHSKEQDRTKLEVQLCSTLKLKGFLLSDLLTFDTKLHGDNKFANTLLNVLRKEQNG